MEDNMKIYIKQKSIKADNYNILVKRFPNVEFIDNVEDSYQADVAIVFPGFVTEENLKKYPNLKWIQLITAGFDKIDFNAIKNYNLEITNAKGVYSKTIAEDVFCKILTINRNVKYYLNNMETKEWKHILNEPEICNSTVGIIGVGSIAKEIAKRMLAFEAKVIGYRRKKVSEEFFSEIFVGEEGLEDFLKKSDYVILALPLNENSIGLINKDKLNYMKDTSVLINISRGEIIVQDDLIEALKNKKIRAAALDVTSPEPLPKDSQLWELENVFITPHNSVSSPYLYDRITELLIENIQKYLNNIKLENEIIL